MTFSGLHDCDIILMLILIWWSSLNKPEMGFELTWPALLSTCSVCLASSFPKRLVMPLCLGAWQQSIKEIVIPTGQSLHKPDHKQRVVKVFNWESPCESWPVCVLCALICEKYLIFLFHGVLCFHALYIHIYIYGFFFLEGLVFNTALIQLNHSSFVQPDPICNCLPYVRRHYSILPQTVTWASQVVTCRFSWRLDGHANKHRTSCPVLWSKEKIKIASSCHAKLSLFAAHLSHLSFVTWQ